MKKVNTHLYEVSKKEIKELSEETQVLVFNAFDVKYYIEKPSKALLYSASSCYFFLFDKEE